jgi:prolyl 4-hydroxylase
VSQQVVTPALREWIVAQAAAGVDSQAVLSAMKQSGWDEAVALRAMESTLEAYLREQAKLVTTAPDASPVEPTLPAAQLSEGQHEWLCGEQPVSLVLSLQSPRLCVFDGFLSAEECMALMQSAGERLTRSETVRVGASGNEVNDARTSDGMFFERGETDLCRRIEARIAALFNWPVERGEGLQILRYRAGAEYKPHFDYFDPRHAGTPAILSRGGQRVATLIMYLSTPAQGGATIFPDAGLSVAPREGRAVFFSYDRADPATLTLHGGAPVREGEKWVATKWLRQRRFD